MIDGPTLVSDALDAGVVLEEVVVEPGCPDGLIARAEAAGAIVRRVAVGVLARASDAVNPQPVAAIARLGTVSPDEAAAAAGPLALVLVAVGDPGNAGALLRSAEAAGGGAVLFCDGSVDPYAPKCVRASAGSVFRLAVTRSASAGEALRALGAVGLTTVATLPHGAQAYDEADLAGSVAFVLGSEAHGLPEAVAEQVERTLTIPMPGRTQSLNVAMAGTILCFEALRQRRNRLDGTPPEAAGCSNS